MRYNVIYEKIREPEFEGEYYAHIPAFDLTTQGMGIDGAREAAEDLLRAWIEVKLEHGEAIPPPDDDALLGSINIPIDLPDHALQAA
jgi:predicted RNase H-like HicB family nuclease